MTILDEAMHLLGAFAQEAHIEAEKLPDVRIVFDTVQDQARFKLLLVQKMHPSDAAGAQIGSNTFKVAGIAVELSNKERGSRAVAERIIKDAGEIYAGMKGKRTITPLEISTMQVCLGDLLRLVKGV